MTDPDFQGLNIGEPANKIGAFTTVLLDEATGTGADTTATVQCSAA